MACKHRQATWDGLCDECEDEIMGPNDKTIYTNGAYGDLHTDPEWEDRMRSEGTFVVKPSGLHTAASSEHARMLEEQQRQAQAAQSMIDQYAAAASVSPQDAKTILKAIKDKVSAITPAIEAPLKIFRRLKL